MRRCWLFSLVVVPLFSAPLHAQLARPVNNVADDPSRPYPDFMRLYAQTRGFNLGRPSAARPTPDGKSVLFLASLPTRPALELREFVVATGETRVLLTPEMVLKGAAESQSPEEKARRERMRITVGGFTSYELSRDGTLILLPLSGKLYTFARATGAVKELPVPAGTLLDPHLSPSGKHVAYVRDHNLCVMDLATLKERQLTQGGSDVHTWGLAEFVAQEEMGRMRGFWWSPDDKALLFEEADHAAVEEFFIQDPMHPENPPNAFRYPRAGKSNATVRLWTVPAAGGKPTAVTWDAARYPYVASVTWEENAPATVLVQARDQREEQLLALDATTGTTRVLLEEKDEAWLNIDPEMPWWLKDGSGFLWRTERNGGHELELRDRNGVLVRSIVPVSAGLWDVAAVDEKNRQVFFVGGATPMENSVQRVSLDGGASTEVSAVAGTRTVTFGRDASVYVENRWNPTEFRVTEVFTADGKLAGRLPSSNVEPPFKPNITFARVGEGTGLYTCVIRPRAFVPGRRYPVVLQVYGGPRHNTVTGALDPYLREQWIADHGYIVVGVDGRGTQWRGRAWERAISGDFATLPLQDQVTGLKTLGNQIPEMDLSRVGVMGWSFGGYLSALAVLQRPDVFKTAVSGAPVVDWQDYDTHYTERYLGLVEHNAAGYNHSNLLTHAARLTRPLLLIHGTADDNVYFFHTLKLSNALLRSGRPHTVLPLAGFTHMVPEPQMVERLWERMVEHLSETLHP